MEIVVVGRKHSRVEEDELSGYSNPPLPTPAPKKSAHGSKLSSDEEQQRLRLLEDLYGLNAPSPDPDPDIRDDVVSEMMKSLERVITGSDDFDKSRPALPLMTTNDAASSTSDPFHYASFEDDLDEEEGESSSSHKDQLTYSNPETGVDLTFLLHASDDELGIPATPEQEKLCSETASEDFSWLETAYTAVSSHPSYEDEDIWRFNFEENSLLESRICNLGGF